MRRFNLSCLLHANHKTARHHFNTIMGCSTPTTTRVDIDDALVHMAWRRRCTLWNHQAPLPLPEPVSSCAAGSTTSRLNLMRKRAPQPHPPPAPPEADYFPVSCQHISSPLPIPPTPSSTETGIRLDAGVPEIAFPHNVSFCRADWVNECIPKTSRATTASLRELLTYFPVLPAKRIKKKMQFINNGLPLSGRFSVLTSRPQAASQRV